jgi:predicted DNA-binding WGR domain protein
VQLDGSVQTVRFGRIGTAGQTCTKTFPGAAEAGKATGRLIAQKVNKGYREVTLEQVAQVSPKRKQQQRSPQSQCQQLALPF